jgi:hypothetical protein
MSSLSDARRVTIVTACMRRDGLSDLALTEVEVTPEEFENGIHYDRAEVHLHAAGFEEPFVHFEERDEAPAFLVPAVRQYLAEGSHRSPRPGSIHFQEEPTCSASSR